MIKPIPPATVSLNRCGEGLWEAGRQAAQSQSGLAGSEKPVSGREDFNPPDPLRPGRSFTSVCVDQGLWLPHPWS